MANSITVGSTCRIRFDLAVETSRINALDVTLAQCKRQVKRWSLEDAALTPTSVSVSVDQETSLRLTEVSSAMVQLRARLDDGVIVTQVHTISVKPWIGSREAI